MRKHSTPYETSKIKIKNEGKKFWKITRLTSEIPIIK